MRALLLQVRPELEEGEEIRLLVAERGVGLVGGLLLVQRAIARILDAERRGDHHDLAEAVALGRLREHARDARVHRQAGELAAQPGEAPVTIDRAQLLQHPVAIVDQTPVGGDR